VSDLEDDGFSFGTPSPPPGSPEPFEKKSSGDTAVMANPFADDGETVEVAGEPVSRIEARSMGYSSLGNTRSTRRVSNYANTRILRERLPVDLGEELVQKLEKAWNHLRRNELTEAMTISQEVAWENPSLLAAKLIIARCFIVRRQHDKALAILTAIPEAERDAETMYYIGLCQSRLGKTKEAIQTLQQSRTSSTDTLIRRRANDLLSSLQGDQAVCPLCGHKHSYEAMIELGDRLLCPDCAKKEFDKEGKGGEEGEGWEDEEREPSIRRRLRAPLTRTEKIIRGVFVLFLISILFFGVYLVYLLAPEHYARLRAALPAGQALLPPPPFIPPPPGARGANSPRVIPSLNFTSPPLRKAIAGVPIRQLLAVSGMKNESGVFSVDFKPAPPAGPYDLDPRKGLFTWTPAREDAGKTYSVTFSAVFDNAKARDQVNRLEVSEGPRFEKIGACPGFDPGEALFMASEDLNGDGNPELALFAGDYWKGNLHLLARDGNGSFAETAGAEMIGRPVGIGFIRADTETWLAAADYWNSRLRFFALRDNTLSEMAGTIELPGRPLLADFHAASSLSAAICLAEGKLLAVCYRQTGQVEHEKVGEWELPGGFIWRRILILPSPDEGDPGMLVLGSDFSRAVFLLAPGDRTPRPVPPPEGNGSFPIDVDFSPGRRQLYFLWNQDGGHRLGKWRLAAPSGPERRDEPGGRAGTPAAANDRGRAPASRAAPAGPAASLALEGQPIGLAGFALFNRSDPDSDILILGSTRLGVVFGYGDGETPGEAFFWPLPKPARLFGQPISISRTGAANPEVVYTDEDGGLWTVSLAN
jgi:tetratricopeptide (TPR) repeat protein